jgi:hypothetical protein
MLLPHRLIALAGTVALTLLVGCTSRQSSDLQSRLDQYASVSLTADLAHLTPQERQMIPLLIAAAEQIDEIFWWQSYGNKDALLDTVDDPAALRYLAFNYGPWDRLNGDEPFLAGVGPKPAGANLYPPDMSKQEFEAAVETSPDQAAALRNLYTLVRRRESGSLHAVPYHVAFADRVSAAAAKLTEAAALAEDPGLRRYLELRAAALLTDEYRESDLAWMDMKDNTIDVVIGPIETYEDGLFGYKAAYETFVLLKDKEWSARLSRFAALLPGLQRGLPVDEEYKRETPGTGADLNAYDLLYVAGDANAGSKTIAINLPNDETVQLEKGTRRLQLKNAMRAKFDEILVPIANVLIAEDQRQHITFDAFFSNVMFHEVAHGLGIANTISGRGTVREALREHYSAIEEGKADILGLYMVTELYEQGELAEGTVLDNYVTFLASIFRSVRFGASSAHGRANMVRFNFFQEQGAFTRDETTGAYRVDFDRMKQAMEALSQLILTIQGNGDYEAAGQLLNEKGVIGSGLRNELDRLTTLGIPVDIVYEQGMNLLDR